MANNKKKLTTVVIRCSDSIVIRSLAKSIVRYPRVSTILNVSLILRAQQMYIICSRSHFFGPVKHERL